MKFNTYERTPRIKTPKWITVFLVSFFVFLTAIVLFSGIMLSIEDQSVFPLIITSAIILFYIFLASSFIYNIYNAYFETDNSTITLVSYVFFIRRERRFLLSDVAKIKIRFNPKNTNSLVFKNAENKSLFHISDFPETRSYFESLGFKVE